jgi:hypothetical protein
MATVKRTTTVGDLFIEFGSKDIEIFRIAPMAAEHSSAWMTCREQYAPLPRRLALNATTT